MDEKALATAPKPWERIAGETDDQWEAFNQYLALEKREKGDNTSRRFLSDLAQIRGCLLPWLSRIAKANNWEERAAAYDAFLICQPAKSAALTIRARQAAKDRATGRSLMAKGLKSILKAKPEEITTKDAIAIIKLGMAFQERADRTSNPVTRQEEDELNAGIKQLVAELTRGVGNLAAGGETITVSATERTVGFSVPGKRNPERVVEVPGISGEVLEGDLEAPTDR
jgi:hypothetical protein